MSIVRVWTSGARIRQRTGARLRTAGSNAARNSSSGNSAGGSRARAGKQQQQLPQQTPAALLRRGLAEKHSVPFPSPVYPV
jgi:hypothetical protein